MKFCDHPTKVKATGKILKALLHVRSVFPQVTRVEFDSELRWLYTDGRGFEDDAPSFDGRIDQGLIEDASDEAEINTIYILEGAE